MVHAYLAVKGHHEALSKQVESLSEVLEEIAQLKAATDVTEGYMFLIADRRLAVWETNSLLSFANGAGIA